jgi:uncharacterized membrane protein
MKQLIHLTSQNASQLLVIPIAAFGVILLISIFQELLACSFLQLVFSMPLHAPSLIKLT